MAKFSHLLGSRPQVLYECMYTKHKTQKKKTWHDGFLKLTSERTVTLYDDRPPSGTVLDESRVAPYEWERKDEEYFDFAKFLVEVVDTTPISLDPNAPTASTTPTSVAPPTSTTSRPPPRRAPNARFKAPMRRQPTSCTPSSSTSSKQSINHLAALKPSASPTHLPSKSTQDTDQSSTSEWQYTPQQIQRSPAEVARLVR